jgi:beta-lactamase regulating signal transducer with metallopeptidase domain
VIGDIVTHLVVSSAILAFILATAAWVPRLTARTRHAILVAGLLALVLPAPFVAGLLERNDIAPLPALAEAARFTAPAAIAGGMRTATPPWRAIAIGWALIAAALLIRWWMVTSRLATTALRAATAPPPRTVRALDSARRRLNLRQSIDLIASSTCEAPAVVRVLRPMIILPADGCDSLSDDELESLLCHECAHVARRDNLLGVFEAIACSLFWFNPLVWLTHRRIAAAREAACDERVADAALPAETYVGALAKICRTLLAPRVPAVSCMASAHLKERIQHLMKYESLRTSAFPHGLIAVIAVGAVVLGVAAAGALTAQAMDTSTAGRYRLNQSMYKLSTGDVQLALEIFDSETKKPLGQGSTMTVKPGESGTWRSGRLTPDGNGIEFVVTIQIHADSSGRILMDVNENGRRIQYSTHDFSAPGEKVEQKWSGAPISMNLSKADIKDVMRTFSELTGIDIRVGPGVEGSVNVSAEGVPWDQAFDTIVRDAGYAWRKTDSGIEVYKP